MRGFWIVTAAAAMALVPTSAAEANEPITGGALPEVAQCVPIDPPVIWTITVCVTADDNTNHYPYVEVCAPPFANGSGWCARTHDSPFWGVPGACIDTAVPNTACFFVLHPDNDGDGNPQYCPVDAVGFSWCRDHSSLP